MAQAEHTLREALAAFDFGAPVTQARRFGEGHINDTFLVETGAERFILQRISSAAFKAPDQLMENVVRVTEYLAQKIEFLGGDPRRETLRGSSSRNQS